jgi:2'-5' RNA ligase
MRKPIFYRYVLASRPDPGFHPHLTIGHDRCAFEPFLILHEWVPDELLLIESGVGNGVHNILGRWPLLPARQGLLPFDQPFPPVHQRATGG